MKNIANLFLLSLLVVCFGACEMDNYDAPCCCDWTSL